MDKAVKDKKPFADYIVTQWLLNPEPIKEFISKQTLPVHVGITGPLKISSLINLQILWAQKTQLTSLNLMQQALDLLRPSDPNNLIENVKDSQVTFIFILSVD